MLPTSKPSPLPLHRNRRASPHITNSKVHKPGDSNRCMAHSKHRRAIKRLSRTLALRKVSKEDTPSRVDIRVKPLSSHHTMRQLPHRRRKHLVDLIFLLHRPSRDVRDQSMALIKQVSIRAPRLP